MLRFTFCFIICAIGVSLVKAAFGSTLWDRLLALNLISAKTVMLLCVYSVANGDIMLLDIAIAYSVVGFLGVTLLSNFILKGGRQK